MHLESHDSAALERSAPPICTQRRRRRRRLLHRHQLRHQPTPQVAAAPPPANPRMPVTKLQRRKARGLDAERPRTSPKRTHSAHAPASHSRGTPAPLVAPLLALELGGRAAIASSQRLAARSAQPPPSLAAPSLALPPAGGAASPHLPAMHVGLLVDCTVHHMCPCKGVSLHDGTAVESQQRRQAHQKSVGGAVDKLEYGSRIRYMRSNRQVSASECQVHGGLHLMAGIGYWQGWQLCCCRAGLSPARQVVGGGGVVEAVVAHYASRTKSLSCDCSG